MTTRRSIHGEPPSTVTIAFPSEVATVTLALPSATAVMMPVSVSMVATVGSDEDMRGQTSAETSTSGPTLGPLTNTVVILLRAVAIRGVQPAASANGTLSASINGPRFAADKLTISGNRGA